MSGVGIAVVTAAISGVMTPYSSLPWLLQQFARIYPISSASSSITFLLVGEHYAGYPPLSVGQTAFTVAISLLLFIGGLVAYSRFSWRKE
jgi:ABC-type polysaccharide/polyol phosphate export permease